MASEKEVAQLTVRVSPLMRKQLEYVAGREYRALNDQVKKFLADALDRWVLDQREAPEGYPTGLG